MKNISRRNISGFTLVEILVVVLIIGILSAVAIPMYQGAVDKSRFSTLLPAAKSIKDAEEAMRMSTGLYTDQMQDLDVNMENGELNFTFDVHNNLADPSLFRVTDPKLENVRLASYFDFNPMMAGQKHCEAKTGDKRATRLCEKLLGGQELKETNGYTSYLLDQEIDKAMCDSVSRFWSTSKTKCYRTTADRCEALGIPTIAGQDQCGYTGRTGTWQKNRDNKFVIGTEGVCISNYQVDACSYSTFDQGECQSNSHANCLGNEFKNNSTCKGDNSAACIDSSFYSDSVCEGNVSTACSRSHFYDGGVCIANVAGTCTYRDNVDRASIFESGAMCVGNAVNTCSTGLTLKEGAICIANASGACKADYSLGGCCCGNHCPNGSPQCGDSICSNSKYVK